MARSSDKANTMKNPEKLLKMARKADRIRVLATKMDIAKVSFWQTMRKDPTLWKEYKSAAKINEFMDIEEYLSQLTCVC